MMASLTTYSDAKRLLNLMKLDYTVQLAKLEDILMPRLLHLATRLSATDRLYEDLQQYSKADNTLPIPVCASTSYAGAALLERLYNRLESTRLDWRRLLIELSACLHNIHLLHDALIQIAEQDISNHAQPQAATQPNNSQSHRQENASNHTQIKLPLKRTRSPSIELQTFGIGVKQAALRGDSR
jgi:hypothetical protein